MCSKVYEHIRDHVTCWYVMEFLRYHLGRGGIPFWNLTHVVLSIRHKVGEFIVTAWHCWCGKKWFLYFHDQVMISSEHEIVI